MDAPTITVQALDNHQCGMIEFHRPGCAHTNRRHNDDFGLREMTRDELAEWTAEAKSLGTPGPVAPCLRSMLKATA